MAGTREADQHRSHPTQVDLARGNSRNINPSLPTWLLAPQASIKPTAHVWRRRSPLGSPPDEPSSGIQAFSAMRLVWTGWSSFLAASCWGVMALAPASARRGTSPLPNRRWYCVKLERPVTPSRDHRVGYDDVTLLDVGGPGETSTGGGFIGGGIGGGFATGMMAAAIANALTTKTSIHCHHGADAPQASFSFIRREYGLMRFGFRFHRSSPSSVLFTRVATTIHRPWQSSCRGWPNCLRRG